MIVKIKMNQIEKKELLKKEKLTVKIKLMKKKIIQL
jgi:hypothetical protein